MIVTADLHIHSSFSMAVSPSMSPSALLEACTMKGIGILGTGDASHPLWREAWKDHVENNAGIIVVPSMEVQGEGRVHHLILAESMEIAEAISNRFSPFSRTIHSAGRPHVALSGGDIARIVHEEGGVVGPAHAFTPWTGLYGKYPSLMECYRGENPDFLELGLSADSSYGAGIPELANIPFLSSSDAHSPSPLKVGREFTRLAIKKGSAAAVIEAVCRGEILLNAGFFPEEGKYNRTACPACYRQYTVSGAEMNGWRCPHDGGVIKMGVRDLAAQMSTGPVSPRPPYLHTIPLGEIIQHVLGTSSPNTMKCQALYAELIACFGCEIAVLTDAAPEEIAGVHSGVAAAIEDFRTGSIILYPGGGGKYGTFALQSVKT
ncbi:histidinol-phosphatase [Methanomicrobiaceae archaeon CYW5]|uniref:endonuclease Q family protein n=1 Tax=Methanovulcanius yangii TaxID=1789227 RepID=UPI0029CA8919|nr:endonuclease Q family protein [Methanovulcanius yangii]MBT8507193.1 histidinol-phosphatase [Methanovulcanius yangii]